MHPVATQFHSQIGTIVQDESDVVFLCDRLQCRAGPSNRVIGRWCILRAFQTKLQACDVPRRQRVFKRLREGVEAVAVEIGRADQVEAAAWGFCRTFGWVCDQNLP